MAIKKTELYASLWASCDELRGGMDASQYKDYVLTLLFMKYVSDKYKGDPDALIEVPEGASYDDMIALKGNKEIGDKINKIIGALADANELKGIIDVADFNDEDKLGKDREMIDRLSRLIGLFEGLNLSGNRADGDDLLGDAYEYLMRHFATESGKSKGQFYTPAEVSRVLAKVIGISPETRQDATVFDPTCGSGSLLLKASDEAPRGLSIFGQEMDTTTSALARMNMILHNNVSAPIIKGNSLTDPGWKDANGQLKTFDFAVANPPFSNKNWTNGLNPQDDPYNRFAYGIPPEKNGDYTFLLHILKSLKSTGKGAVILPHGVLFRGNVEARIREKIIRQGYIKGIIGLPANLFYGTGIPACIIVLDKEEAPHRTGIFMIDASRGYMKDGNKNRLRAQDIHKIVDVFTRQQNLKGYSRMVTLQQIADNDYNLNIPRYIDSSEPEDRHDLSAHLQGGIPNRDLDALGPWWQVFPNLRKTLFKDHRPGYSQALIAAPEVKSTIQNHPEFKAFAEQAQKPFTEWWARADLKNLQPGETPKNIIHRISEDLLNAYARTPLLIPYDIYQILMDYWTETLQDDIYVLVQDGWAAARILKIQQPDSKGKYPHKPDLLINKTRYMADLIAPALIIARYFKAEQATIDQLQLDLETASQNLESYLEEHTGDDGLLNDALNTQDKVTAATVKNRLLVTKDIEEIEGLKEAQERFKIESDLRKNLKDRQEALDKAVFKKYENLTEAEIKTLIVEDKWHDSLKTSMEAEIDRMTQQLTNRVKELEERYAESLPILTRTVETLSARVAEHLNAMGQE